MSLPRRRQTIKRMLKEIQLTKTPVTSGRIKEVIDVLGDGTHAKYAGELFGILNGLTSGDAKLVVRSACESTALQDGFYALYLLNCRYNPNSNGNILKGWLEVVSPPKIKNVQGVVKGIEEWTEKIKQVESIENEKALIF